MKQKNIYYKTKPKTVTSIVSFTTGGDSYITGGTLLVGESKLSRQKNIGDSSQLCSILAHCLDDRHSWVDTGLLLIYIKKSISKCVSKCSRNGSKQNSYMKLMEVIQNSYLQLAFGSWSGECVMFRRILN